MGRRGYPPEFRRQVLDLVEAGRSVADVARDLGISAQSICVWRRQDSIDKGLVPGLTSTEKAELAAAKKRIAELEAELAVSRRVVLLLRESADPKEVLGGRGDGRWNHERSTTATTTAWPGPAGSTCREISSLTLSATKGVNFRWPRVIESLPRHTEVPSSCRSVSPPGGSGRRGDVGGTGLVAYDGLSSTRRIRSSVRVVRFAAARG